MESVNEILNLHAKEFQQVLLNVSSGDKLIGCAALSAAFHKRNTSFRYGRYTYYSAINACYEVKL